MATSYKVFHVEIDGKPVQVTRAKSAEQARNNVRWRLRIPETKIRKVVEIQKGE